MKTWYLIPALFALVLTACSEIDELHSVPTLASEDASSSLELRSEESLPLAGLEVYYAQTHVLRPEDEYFGLVSDKAALIKVQLTSEEGEQAPPVTATLTLNGATTLLTLTGPDVLPLPMDMSPGNAIHSFDDSFTALIPKEWVQPGLEVRVEAGEEVVEHKDLSVGAPNKILMNMFDIHFFAPQTGGYPDGWKEELESKWPSAGIELRHAKNITFPEVTILPRNGHKALRISEMAEYWRITGEKFEGESATAIQWNSALSKAAGREGEYSLFFINMFVGRAGGLGVPFGGVAKGTSPGLLSHELGHALYLRHSSGDQNYPYKGDMFGIKKPKFSRFHVGPTWAYDLNKEAFISPRIQITNSNNGNPGLYKEDPMSSGGEGTQDAGYIFNHFSDYSVNRMRENMQQKMVVWNNAAASYAKWDEMAGEYSRIVNNNGVQYPVERNQEVISVMAGVSSVSPEATIAYPPIGPYTSGLIDLFDPQVAQDRQRAGEVYCQEGCDVSLRVEQGGVTMTYMLPIKLDDSLSETHAGSYKVSALNLRASDGPVTKVEVLHTPAAEKNGLPAKPAVLTSWEE